MLSFFIYHTIFQIDKINNYMGDYVILCLSSKRFISHAFYLWGVYGFKTFENIFHKAERDNCDIVRIGSSYQTELFLLSNTVFWRNTNRFSIVHSPQTLPIEW
jgi:hypothetical protein